MKGPIDKRPADTIGRVDPPVEVYRPRKKPFYLKAWAWVLLGILAFGVIAGLVIL